MAGFNLPPDFQITFHQDFIEVEAQQTEHRLRGMYKTEMVEGESLRLSLIGAQSYAMQAKSARYAPSEPTDIPLPIRWVTPAPFDKVTWIDEDDALLLGTLGDPQGAVVRNHAIAVNRLKDQTIINGLVGVNFTGANRGTSTTLLTTNQLGVNFGSGAANSGLTLAKITQMSYLMDAADVSNEGRVLIVAAKQINDLLTNVDQVNNVMYNDVRALHEGTVTNFMGFKVIRTQLLPFVGTSTTLRTIIAYQINSCYLGMGKDIRTYVDIIPQQSHTLQIRTKLNIGATRSEELPIVTAVCDETL
jgi:hypothetical protein